MKRYLVIFERTDTGYSVYVPDLPGCIATGKTKEEAEKNIYEAIELHIQGIADEGFRLPEIKSESEVILIN